DPTKQVAIGTLVLLAGLFFFQEFYVSRLLLGGFVVFDWLLLVALRLAFLEWTPRLREKLGGGYYILLVGTGPRAQELAGLIRESQRAGMHLVGLVATEEEKERPDGGPEPIWRLDDVPRLLREHVVDEVIFCVRREELERLENLLLVCEEQGVRTRVQLQVFPHLVSQVHLDHLRHVPLLTFSTTPENELHLLVKRVADTMGAGLLVVISSPLMLLLALLVRFTSPGPVLYRQERCGLGGRRFLLYKFRSMVADADLRREELRALNELDGPVFKMTNDPRC
ncbi:MAG: sugar transferase, partial [Anaerolineae bacterium]|nr:sugar transferase [Anaerolineae bacterium]